MASTPEVHDIFVSYDNDDLDLVTTLVQQLTAVGWRVWWDRGILPGQTWDEVISQFLKSARCIVVVWTRRSVESHWVRIEANHGREREVLVPVRLDDAELPLQFGLVHTASLVGWDYHSIHPGLNALMAGVRAVLSRDPAPLRSAAGESVAGEPRALDAAIGRQLLVEQPASLIAMIRLARSEGLRALLESDSEHSLKPEDVSSRPFDLTFPVDAAGHRQPAELAIRICAPAFDPPEQRKKMRVAPERDSTVFEFLLTPLKVGPALVQVEIYERDVCMASRVLRPSCVAEQPAQGCEVVSLPLHTHVGEGKPASRAAAAAASSLGEFTRMFGTPAAGSEQHSAPAASSSGEFTRMFDPSAADSEQHSQEAASSSGEFTQTFGGPAPGLGHHTAALSNHAGPPRRSDAAVDVCPSPSASAAAEPLPQLAEKLPSTGVLIASVLAILAAFVSVIMPPHQASGSLPEPGSLAETLSVTNAAPVIARHDAMVLLFDERPPAPTPGRRLVFSRGDALVSLVTVPEQ